MSWKKYPLGKICDVRDGTHNSPKYVSSGFPLVTSKNIKDGRLDVNGASLISAEDFHEINRRSKVDKGDILMPMIGTIGNPVLIEEEPEFAIKNVCLIKRSSAVVPKYLLYLLNSDLFEQGLLSVSRGGTQKFISLGDIRKFEIPLPPLAEQERIADTLDKADALRRKDQELLQKYDELIQSIFYEMFGNPSANEKSWDMLTVRDLVREVKYGTSSPASEQGAFPYLRMNNITYGGELNLRDLKRIDVSEADYRKYGVQMDDLLFNRTNSKELVGKTTVVDVEEPMVAAGYLIRVRCNELANPYFISAYLNSKVGKRILLDMCKSIVGMANINAQELQNIPIIAPPKALQDAFADKVLAVKKLRFAAVKNTELSEALFASQLQHYF